MLETSSPLCQTESREGASMVTACTKPSRDTLMCAGICLSTLLCENIEISYVDENPLFSAAGLVFVVAIM